MEYSNDATNTAAAQPYYGRPVSPPSQVSSEGSPPPVFPFAGSVPSSPPTVVLSPCAACKVLRRRCADGCMLAPYFPPTEPAKFTTAHRVFGASNIIKLLQDLPEHSRADAVSSMVYEAEARLRDPVYGCAGAVCRLQKEANELKVQLARAQADLHSVQAQHANLLAIVCVEFATQHQQQHPPPPLVDQLDGFGAGPGGSVYPSLCTDSDDLDSAAWEEARRQLWT
ncbi:LOB domain-containing protein 1 [Lolium perenne]|uniref:LOB domain-containing protein 1 n=1 Tax=Lolium perenne TaxID=4522 RepID=UPI0021F56F90|nr:LOB domain-containing protein 1 [Lolium perenne]